MIGVTYAGLIAGAIACLIFAGLCIRPALRLRTLTIRLAKHPSLLAIEKARDSFESFAAAGTKLEEASHRFETAATTINAAAASVGAYASQISIMAFVVDASLELLVPRLRGMLHDWY
ncbi:MAG TPA: hypothetical protein VII69_11845 [Candidatus Eremiobacteraceae bacterium]